jgi:hypothetical protein
MPDANFGVMFRIPVETHDATLVSTEGAAGMRPRLELVLTQ